MTTTGEDAAAGRPDGTIRRAALESTLVCYEDGPDRLTVYPPGLSSAARMSMWLTADADAFRDLEAVR
ncbi:hypothetical protein BRD14_06105 [Halobacteriales archaeon SW_5_68_122]|nr:MAG: hypothetical protein BRD14_06105 [Halobacteriales archaeon SW_5_68_122]